MDQSQGSGVEVGVGVRQYRSPNRILARSFRLGRDAWRDKHHAVQAKLEQERQLSAERGESRDRWKADCQAATARALAAELLAQQRLAELEQVRASLVQCAAGLPKKR